MSESKWTPGPWFVSGVRFKMNGGEWLSVNRYDEQTKKDENIALAGYDPRNGAGTADARLISASPDLADVVETRPVLPDIAQFLNSEIAREVTAEFPDIVAFLGNFAAWDDRARAALSRAKGETT